LRPLDGGGSGFPDRGLSSVRANVGAMATTDWGAWHLDYDDPDSALSRRLRIVQNIIRGELEARRPRPVTVLSACAGDGRDLLEVLAGGPDADRVTAHLIEKDPRLVADARAAIQRAGLRSVSVACADAGTTDAYLGHGPADLVLACGVFGNITDRDVERMVRSLPRLCRAGALVIWTRHRRAPNLTPSIRGWFDSAGFDEVAFEGPPDLVSSVGAHRFRETPRALAPGQKLFTFVR
jgi:hypothetical protein